ALLAAAVPLARPVGSFATAAPPAAAAPAGVAPAAVAAAVVRATHRRARRPAPAPAVRGPAVRGPVVPWPARLVRSLAPAHSASRHHQSFLGAPGQRTALQRQRARVPTPVPPARGEPLRGLAAGAHGKAV